MARPSAMSVWRTQGHTLPLGTLYALGHGSIVVVLGLLAIVAAEVLPDWSDPFMERVVGVTLIFLAGYLCYALYRFFCGGEEFRIRSRWMIIFAAVGSLYHRVIGRLTGRSAEHRHIDPNRQYSARTAFGIGMIHGVGAETGTQALIIATAVGASSKAMSVVSLLIFVVGLLLSNSFVTVVTTTGSVSARRRQAIYVAVGVVAAVFSLVVVVVFLFGSGDILPNLDRYFRWIGGPSTE